MFINAFGLWLLFPFGIGYAGNFYVGGGIVCSQIMCEKQCNIYGRHLSSIHTESQNENVVNECQCDSCWIGMEITSFNNITTMDWMDATDVEISVINESWCSGYPIIYNYDNSISYYTYIDSNDNCWKSTTNTSLEMCGVCGPQMFDTTGLLWISQIIPFVLSIISLPYSIYCAIYLSYHLYGIEHNWLLYPTSYIKVTAVLIPSMSSIIFAFSIAGSIILYKAYESTEIMPPSHAFDSDYPDIYNQYAVIQGGILLFYYFYIPLGYIHVLLRLQHEFNHNEIMQRVKVCSMSWKCCYWIIIILICIYCSTLPIYQIVNVTLSNANSNDWEYPIKIFIMAIGATADFLINSILLLLYVKGLYKYSYDHYWRYDTMKQNENANTMDNRMHELMIEATRYTVLFSIVSIVNVVSLIGVAGLYYLFKDYFENWDNVGSTFQYVRHIVTLLMIYLKEMVLLIAIHLSFKFSHTKYEKVCKICDKWMKNKCHKILRKESAKIAIKWEVKHNANSYNQPLLQNQTMTSDIELN